MTVDIKWYYHRKSWTSCTRAQEFLGPKNIPQPDHVIANKIKIHEEEALDLAHKAQQVWVTKGKKLFQFTWADGATNEEVAALILGRSGTLRAPAFQAGDTFMVGYSEEAYTALFG